MKKVAVFGKPGSGKSVLSKTLAHATGLPLHQLDSIVYKPDGEFVDREEFNKTHDTIIASDEWIVDGLGPLGSFHQRLDAADTLVFIDLPYSVSYWYVTKRLLKGLLVKPEGWPDGSSVLKGTINSYKTLRLCPKFWNEEFLSQLLARHGSKNVYIIKTVSQLNEFVLKHS